MSISAKKACKSKLGNLIWIYTASASSYLVHARLIESHYGGMGQPVKHSPQSLLGVKLLRLKQLLQELFVEHGGYDVIHY